MNLRNMLREKSDTGTTYCTILFICNSRKDKAVMIEADQWFVRSRCGRKGINSLQRGMNELVRIKGNVLYHDCGVVCVLL